MSRYPKIENLVRKSQQHPGTGIINNHQIKHVYLFIDNMLSKRDYSTIEKELNNNPGIRGTKIFAPKKIKVSYDSSITGLENIFYTLITIGYPVSNKNIPQGQKSKG